MADDPRGLIVQPLRYFVVGPQARSAFWARCIWMNRGGFDRIRLWKPFTAKARKHVLRKKAGMSPMSTKHPPGTDSSLSESADFLAKNWGNLQRDYAGKWVALAGRSVRLFDDDLPHLQDQIQLTCPEETLLVDRIPAPGEELDWK